jgi:hypothetical protein
MPVLKAVAIAFGLILGGVVLAVAVTVAVNVTNEIHASSPVPGGDSGTAALLGALIGGALGIVGGVVGSSLSAYLEDRRQATQTRAQVLAALQLVRWELEVAYKFLGAAIDTAKTFPVPSAGLSDQAFRSALPLLAEQLESAFLTSIQDGYLAMALAAATLTGAAGGALGTTARDSLTAALNSIGSTRDAVKAHIDTLQRA